MVHVYRFRWLFWPKTTWFCIHLRSMCNTKSGGFLPIFCSSRCLFGQNPPGTAQYRQKTTWKCYHLILQYVHKKTTWFCTVSLPPEYATPQTVFRSGHYHLFCVKKPPVFAPPDTIIEFDKITWLCIKVTTWISNHLKELREVLKTTWKCNYPSDMALCKRWAMDLAPWRRLRGRES